MVVTYFDSNEEHDWVQDMTYEEIPAEYFRRTLWSESLKGRWRDPEDISVLEIRNVVKAEFDFLKFQHVHHLRPLFLLETWEYCSRVPTVVHGPSNSLSSCGSFVVCV